MGFKALNKYIVKDIVMVIIGSLITALGINMFLIHANLLSGGLSGITLIIQYVTGFPAAYSLLILNIPLFFLSYKKVNKKFTFLSLIGTIALSVGLILTEPLKNTIQVNDILLLGLYGGVLNGIGVGIVFSNHGSTGGLDIVSALIKKKYGNFDIGTITFIVNFIIVSISACIFGLTSALYTLVSMYIASYLVDKVIKGFNRQKLILIITEKEEDVSKVLMSELNRGVTFLYAKGAYTKKDKKVLYCVVSLSQLPKLKLIVKDIDEGAFISILDASEVEGRGFKKASL
ncbi:YitT family protein [Clostridium botulinum]|uniref:YitT family protein n=1 Tax=Clostridium TaxID=1485 RepID=UPI002237768A|nr:YitT family protein [Clostridium sporogenes]EKO1911034.1 YitT family protein [Clostridium botulinum]EKO2041095.1 YitT family protein [Clostridium botulinum]MCW6076318.1 YitT family protein [Clostridium sporogenes]